MARAVERVNAQGEWRCSRCSALARREVFLPPSAFHLDHARGAPRAHCKACARVMERQWKARARSCPAYRAEESRKQQERRARQARDRTRARRRDERERAQLALVLLRQIWGKGLTKRAVERICGVTRVTQLAIEERGTLSKHWRALDRLVVLHQICLELPPLAHTGWRIHPYEAHIQRRYAALRAELA